MRRCCDMSADLIEMHLHGFGVRLWQHQGRADPALGADGSEQIGVLVALIGRLARPRAFLRPLPDLPILLAQSGFILEPYLDRRAFRQIGYMRGEGSGEVFLNASITRSS